MPRRAKGKPASADPNQPQSGESSGTPQAAQPTQASSTDTSPIFFYGTKSDREYDYFSQHYVSKFKAPKPESSAPETTFNCGEKWMMYQKAVLFKDLETAKAIMETDSPMEHKALGRLVKNFDEDVWKRERERIVEEGNWWKFTGCGDWLKEKLLETGDRELVEAAPRDRVWGFGFGRERAMKEPRSKWGLNLLGKALMKIRERIRAGEIASVS